MSKLKTSRSIFFPPPNLLWCFRSAFLLASSYDLLENFCGESSPYQTRLFVQTPLGLRELKQFMELEERIDLIATGPHSELLFERLQDFIIQRLAEIIFDEDGYCQDSREPRSIEINNTETSMMQKENALV